MTKPIKRTVLLDTTSGPLEVEAEVLGVWALHKPTKYGPQGTAIINHTNRGRVVTHVPTGKNIGGVLSPGKARTLFLWLAEHHADFAAHLKLGGYKRARRTEAERAIAAKVAELDI